MLKKTVKFMTCVFALNFVSVDAGQIFHSLVESSKILPGIRLYADYHIFMHQKDSLFKEQYHSEQNMYVEMILLQMYDRFSLNFRSEQRCGLGRSPVGMVFRPRDASFGLIQYFEFKYSGILYQLGLDHRCFHEIDKNEFPSIFWNKLIVEIASDNYRLHDYTRALCVDRKWNLRDRFGWSCIYGYYLRELPGVESSKIMSDFPGYTQEFTAMGKVALLHWKNWILNFNNETQFGIEKEDAEENGKKIYWSQINGIETDFAFSKFGGSLFFNYILDGGKQIFDSKDQLIEIGLKLFNK